MLPNTITHLRSMLPALIDLNKTIGQDPAIKGKAEVQYIAEAIADPQMLLLHVSNVGDFIDRLHQILAPDLANEGHRSDLDVLERLDSKFISLHSVPNVLGTVEELKATLVPSDDDLEIRKKSAAWIFCDDQFIEAYKKLVAVALRYHTIPESLRDNEFDVLGRALNSLITIFFNIIVRAEKAFIGAEIFDKEVLNRVYNPRIEFISFEKLPTKTYFTPEEEQEMAEERMRQEAIEQEKVEVAEMQRVLNSCKNAFDSTFSNNPNFPNYDNHIFSMVAPAAVKRLMAAMEAMDLVFDETVMIPQGTAHIAELLHFEEDQPTREIFINQKDRTGHPDELATYADLRSAFTLLTDLGLFKGEVWDADDGQMYFSSHEVTADETAFKDWPYDDSPAITENHLFTIKKSEE